MAYGIEKIGIVPDVALKVIVMSLVAFFGALAPGVTVYIIHALNTVYIEEFDKWIRLDARGNKENVHAQFSIDEECLAFPVREDLGEIDYRDNHPDLDSRLFLILQNSFNALEIIIDFRM